MTQYSLNWILHSVANRTVVQIYTKYTQEAEHEIMLAMTTVKGQEVEY
jgi:hypothetical protein